MIRAFINRLLQRTRTTNYPTGGGHLYGGPCDGETIPIPTIDGLPTRYLAYHRHTDEGEEHRYISTGQHADCGCLVLVYMGQVQTHPHK